MGYINSSGENSQVQGVLEESPRKANRQSKLLHQKVSRYPNNEKDPTTNSENRTQKWYSLLLTTKANDI